MIYPLGLVNTKQREFFFVRLCSHACAYKVNGLNLGVSIVFFHTKIDLSWIDLRSISVRFEKVFTLI